MKKIINAQNGSIEFDNDDDIEIWRCLLTAKNTWGFVGDDHPKFILNPDDEIVVIHVFGKNTIANPEIFLSSRLRKYPEGTILGPTSFHNNPYGLTMKGMVDINFLYHPETIPNIHYGQFPQSLLDMQIEGVSVFTGYLYINVYVKRNSR